MDAPYFDLTSEHGRQSLTAFALFASAGIGAPTAVRLRYEANGKSYCVEVDPVHWEADGLRFRHEDARHIPVPQEA